MPSLSNADIAWAIYHGWVPRERRGARGAPQQTIFVHKTERNCSVELLGSWLAVVPNPLAEKYHDGWVPWISCIGALQCDAPFESVRAALRVTESIRLGRHLEADEIRCGLEVPEMIAFAYAIADADAQSSPERTTEPLHR